VKPALILVPTWKRADCVDKWIEVNLKSTLALELCDVMFIINGDNDTQEVLDRHISSDLVLLRSLGYIKLKSNLGIAAALNLGIYKFKDKYDYIIRMDDDFFIKDKLWLQKLVNLQNSIKVSILLMKPNYLDYSLNMSEDSTDSDTVNYAYANDDEWGQLTMISRDCLNAVGYYREDYGYVWCEDRDMIFRTRVLGFKTVITVPGTITAFHRQWVVDNKEVVSTCDELVKSGVVDKDFQEINRNKLEENKACYLENKETSIIKYDNLEDVFTDNVETVRAMYAKNILNRKALNVR